MSLALWNHPVTAARYELFTDRHDRYRAAGAALAQAAALAPGHSVLDMAAGIGCTALACLKKLGKEGAVTAVEAADAMRQTGQTRTSGSPVFWQDAVPDNQQFDRVICGASLWAMGPVDETIGTLAAHVAPGGSLAVSLPAAYLGEADAPGGGTDPWLTALPEALSRLGFGTPPPPAPPALTEAGLAETFSRHGLSMTRMNFVQRLTQAAYRDWMMLPPVNEILLGKLPPEDRLALVAQTAETLDMCSWRWETWALCVGVRRLSP